MTSNDAHLLLRAVKKSPSPCTEPLLRNSQATVQELALMTNQFEGCSSGLRLLTNHHKMVVARWNRADRQQDGRCRTSQGRMSSRTGKWAIANVSPTIYHSFYHCCPYVPQIDKHLSILNVLLWGQTASPAAKYLVFLARSHIKHLLNG